MTNFLKYGLMAGGLHAVYSIVLFLIKSDLRFNMTLAISLLLILPLIFMVMALKAERNDQEGLISFGEGLKTSFLTYLIYIIIVMFVGYVLMGMYSEDDWQKILEIQQNTMSATLNMVGADQVLIDTELDKITIEGVKEQTAGVGPIMMNILVYSFVGLISSLIISAIMKKNPTP